MIRQSFARYERLRTPAGACHTHLARQMTLGTNTVSPFGRELGRIHKRRSACGRYMSSARSMAALTCNAAFQEWSGFIPVLRQRPMLHRARMALQAPRHNRPRQKRLVVLSVPGRKIPLRLLRVVRNRGLVEETVQLKQIASRDGSRPNKERQTPSSPDVCPLDQLQRITGAAFVQYPIPIAGPALTKLGISKLLPDQTGTWAPAAHRHRSCYIGPVNPIVTGLAGPAPHPLLSGCGKGNGSQDRQSNPATHNNDT